MKRDRQDPTYFVTIVEITRRGDGTNAMLYGEAKMHEVNMNVPQELDHGHLDPPTLEA